MARGKKNARTTQEMAPRSAGLATKPITTGAEFATLMSAVMSDVLTGSIEPQVANAACNVGAKLLKVVEMQYRYGKRLEGTEERLLALVPLAATPEAPAQIQ